MEELKACPLDEARKVLWYCAQFTDNTHWAKQYRKALTDICNELDRRVAPESKALTVEQLRQMDGKPVWIVPLTPMIDEFKPHWCIMRSEATAMSETNKGKMWFLHLCDYGKTWKAYAHNPEGSAP